MKKKLLAFSVLTFSFLVTTTETEAAPGRRGFFQWFFQEMPFQIPIQIPGLPPVVIGLEPKENKSEPAKSAEPVVSDSVKTQLTKINQDLDSLIAETNKLVGTVNANSKKVIAKDKTQAKKLPQISPIDTKKDNPAGGGFNPAPVIGGKKGSS